VILLLTLLCLPAAARGQVQPRASDLPRYHETLPYALTSPSAYPAAYGGFANPGAYGTLPINGDIQYVWKSPDDDFFDIREWGLFVASRQFGFGLVRKQVPAKQEGEIAYVNDARVALAASRAGVSFGIAYGWISGDEEAAPADVQFIQAGFVRNWRFLAFGIAGKFSVDELQDRASMGDLALRPFGNSFLTLFADAELPFGVTATEALWSAGLRLEPARGFSLTGRYYDDQRFSAALSVSWGDGWRAGVNQFFDEETSQPGLGTYELRWGFKERSIMDRPAEPADEPGGDGADAQPGENSTEN
jgi:hypothetical protein